MVSYYVPSDDKKEQALTLKAFIDGHSGITDLSSDIVNNELILTLGNKERFLDLIKFLKDSNKCLFNQLIDITAVDYPEREDRFEIVYMLLSLPYNLRLRIKISVAENQMVESLVHFYSNADWLEREVWDMFGVYFKNHPDLRRILTDFGFDGHPLRKDFPLTGFMEVIFDEETQKVVYKPVELMHAYRNFSSKNPWLVDVESDTFAHIKKNEGK